MISYNLAPMDTRKSFYGKALVIIEKGKTYLRSYNTIVCMIDENGLFHKLWNGYSVTTMRHINSFRLVNGLCKISKANWENLVEG